MKNYKKDDLVWVSLIEFTPAGRIRYNVKPYQAKVTNFDPSAGRISIDSSWWYIPSTYEFKDIMPEVGSYYYKTWANIHISDTKEGAIENYNRQLKDEIEKRYSEVRNFELSALSRLL